MNSLAWLDALPRFSILKYNLFRIWLLLNKFVPETSEFRVFFITGSKGKGTVSATLAAVLRAAGFQTGLITSPHLVNVNERINLNCGDIEESALENYLDIIMANLPPLPARYGTWIHGEVLLTAAFLCFREQGAATAVVEAGLGGRLDSGNVFRRPLASCISSVAMEHRGILGNTLAEIAGEKAGSIKPHTPVVTAASGIALEVVIERAKLLSAPVLVYGRDFMWGEEELLLPGIAVPVRPDFPTDADRVNKALAACLACFHPGITEAAIIHGLPMGQLPGRFEVLPGNPIYVLDVAHTPESVDNLVAGIARRFSGRKTAFVAGFLADKPALPMLDKMLTAAGRVYFAPVQDKRSFSGDGINIPGGIQSTSISVAMAEAAAHADVICVTGSFAAVREARMLLSKGK